MPNFTTSFVTIWHTFQVPDGGVTLALDRFIVRWDTFFRLWSVYNETMGEDGAIHATAYDPQDPQEIVSLVIDPLSALVVEYRYFDRREGIVRTFSLFHGEYREEKETVLVVR